MSMTNIFKGVASVFTGGLSNVGEKVVDIIKNRFPEKMSEAEKSQLELEVMKVVADEKLKTLEAWNTYDSQFQNFVKDMEGTTNDLRSIPIIGHIIILLRGAFRPICCYSVLFTFIKVLSGSWNIDTMYTVNAAQAWSLLWIIVLLTFSFTFGERAIKNLMPLIERIVGLKYNGKNGSNSSPNGG